MRISLASLLILGALGICFIAGASQGLAADPKAQGTGSVTGLVLDASDKPMVGFAVKLYSSEPIDADRSGSRRKKNSTLGASEGANMLAEKLAATAITDATGRFTFSNVKVGAYLLKGGGKNTGFIYMDANVEANKTNDLGTIKLTKL